MARYLEEELSFLDNYKDVFNDSMFQQSLLWSSWVYKSVDQFEKQKQKNKNMSD
jgi:hypothetical protein